MSRSADFDCEFRLLNSALADRWRRLERAVSAGFEPPPVELVQLGELYFVGDGHHRVSVARARGQREIRARVRRICTIAYAMACLRLAHLPSKAAECRFLARVPLPDELRTDLWLDEPADWARLADAAEAWAWRRAVDGCPPVDRQAFAENWWAEEVAPVLRRLRAAGIGLDLRDVELYVAALAIRDRRGSVSWSVDAAG